MRCFSQLQLVSKFVFSGLFFLSASHAEAFSVGATPEELNGMISNECSGFILDMALPDSAHPLLLTNGHCATEPMMSGTEILGDFPLNRHIGIYGADSKSYTASDVRVIYATMIDTDVAILELPSTTIGARRAKGIQMYPIADSSTVGDTIEVISGEWREKLVCKISYMVDQLLEGDTLSRNVFALGDSCVAKGGFSGSPMFNKNKEVVGLLTTGYDGTGPDCSENNPCELRPGGEKFINADLSYATQVRMIKGCFNSTGNFELNLPSCNLPKPFTRKGRK